MSETGYIRLTYDQLLQVSLVHLVSGVDEDAPTGPSDGAQSTAISGYTEWLGQGGLVITVGWDWQMLPDNLGFHLKRISAPSSNLMLLDNRGSDLGSQKTAVLLENFIDGFNWQSETLQYINFRYSR